MLHESKAEAGFLLDAELEELIAHLNIYGVGAWENLFDQLTSASVEMDGESKTLTELRNLAYDPDQGCGIKPTKLNSRFILKSKITCGASTQSRARSII